MNTAKALAEEVIQPFFSAFVAHLNALDPVLWQAKTVFVFLALALSALRWYGHDTADN